MPQQTQLSFPRPTRVVLRLLIVLGGLWLLLAIMQNLAGSRLVPSLYAELALTPTDVIPRLHVWQLASYAWLHDLEGLTHILFNGLALYFLGPTLERRWGGSNFLRFWIITAILAGVFSVIVGLVFGGRWDVPIVGASGAIFALLAAFSVLFPNAQMLLFFVVPVRARWIIWIAIVGDILFYIASPRSMVAIQTHLGGALAGWLLVTGNWRPGIFVPKIRSLFGGRRRPRSFKVYPGGRDHLH
jgi:membrane associated rhomboid family serine protease